MKFLFAAIIVVCSVSAEAQLVLIDQSEAQTAQRTPTAPQKPSRAIRRPELIIYSESWCGACQIAKRDLASRYPWIDLDIRSGSEIPGWVNALPTFHWQDSAGKWRQSVGWGSVSQRLVIEGMTELRSDQQAVSLPDEAQPTPHKELHRLLAILEPKAGETFIDPGCGADARACLIASSIYGCHSVGIEIEKGRADQAKQRVKEAGLEDLVTIIHGDSTKLNWQADLGFVYLYPDLLQELLPKLQKLKRFASYQHSIEGVRMRQSGPSFIHDASVQQAASQQSFAVWKGQRYTGRVCTSANCQMCNSISNQLRR